MMEETESQVAKIQIGNFKFTSSYVMVTAERALGSEAEIYVIAELPLLNPAAVEQAEHVCLAINASLKRAYKRPATASTFENAVAEINDDLAKLAEMGQTFWVNKLNCIVAVKDESTFHISTTGKVVAYLFRGEDFTDISCSSEKPHILKTFENLAAGKIRLGDMFILSTTQLFNYIAVDRLKSVLESNSFLQASQTIIEILKENAGPEVAFGTIFNLQVEKGETPSEEIDLEEYETVQTGPKTNLREKVRGFFTSFALAERLRRKPKVDLPPVSLPQRLKNVGGATKQVFHKSRGLWTALGKGIAAGRQTFSLTTFKGFSREKKFFLISAVVLGIAAIISVSASLRMKKGHESKTQIQHQLDEVTQLIGKSEASLLYKDEAGARQFLQEAAAKLPKSEDVPRELQESYASAQASLTSTRQKLEKIKQVQVVEVGNLGNGEKLIRLPTILAMQSGSVLVSFNKENGLIQDGQVKSARTITESVFVKNGQAVIYSEGSLHVWNYETGELGTAFTTSVPAAENTVGLAAYPTTSRVYTINKQSGQILSFLVGTNSLSRPVAWAQSMDLTSALDLAVDGAIYVLNPSGITKYQSGKLAEFHQAQLSQPFSGKGKLYTEKDYHSIYLLDAGNNRVIIFDKNGELVQTLVSPEFRDLKDFAVDEAASTIYLLAGSTLLKVSY